MTDPATTSAQPSTEAMKLADELHDVMRGVTPRPPADEAISLDWRLCDRILTALRQSPPLPLGDEIEALIARVDYILDPSASAFERAGRRARLTNHDLRTIRAALSNMRGKG